MPQAASFAHTSPQPLAGGERGSVIPFQRTLPQIADGGLDTISNALLAMDATPLAEPIILPARDMAGHPFVGLTIGAKAFRLTPDEARLAARTLWADPGEPGFADIARRLDHAACTSERIVRDRAAGR